MNIATRWKDLAPVRGALRGWAFALPEVQRANIARAKSLVNELPVDARGHARTLIKDVEDILNAREAAKIAIDRPDRIGYTKIID